MSRQFDIFSSSVVFSAASFESLISAELMSFNLVNTGGDELLRQEIYRSYHTGVNNNTQFG